MFNARFSPPVSVLPSKSALFSAPPLPASAIRKKFLAAVIVALISGNIAHSATTFSDFESFTPGSVHGQGGWTVADSFGNQTIDFDQAVVDDGTGNLVWRFSDGVSSTSYSNQPFFGSTPLIAGETGAGLYNDYGTNHTSPNNPPLSSGTSESRHFYGAWSFTSATGGAQEGLSIGISPGARQGPLRMSLLRIDDTGSGFSLTLFETVGDSFSSFNLAQELSYFEWHRVEMWIEFVDGRGEGGLGNDILTVSLDGNVVHTGTTWESYYHGLDPTSPQAVDSLLFRVASGDPSRSGGGLFFDDVEISNLAIPEPSAFGLIAIGIGALFLRTRIKRG